MSKLLRFGFENITPIDQAHPGLVQTWAVIDKRYGSDAERVVLTRATRNEARHVAHLLNTTAPKGEKYA